MPRVVVQANPVTRSWSYRILKRGVDVAGAAVLLVLLAPVIAGVALLIRFVSPEGPVLHPWRVVGLGGRPFRGYKFRSMVPNAEELEPQLRPFNEMRGPAFKLTNDPRVTAIGHFLRKYSLDELPQLWSVLRGDLSLVGPRPPLRTEWAEFQPWHRRKLSVKPGITCLWQVQGRNDIYDFDEWVKLDLKYIDNWSLRLDFKILLLTIPAVIRGTGK